MPSVFALFRPLVDGKFDYFSTGVTSGGPYQARMIPLTYAKARVA
jgi:hypothetical protein